MLYLKSKKFGVGNVVTVKIPDKSSARNATIPDKSNMNLNIKLNNIKHLVHAKMEEISQEDGLEMTKNKSYASNAMELEEKLNQEEI